MEAARTMGLRRRNGILTPLAALLVVVGATTVAAQSGAPPRRVQGPQPAAVQGPQQAPAQRPTGPTSPGTSPRVAAVPVDAGPALAQPFPQLNPQEQAALDRLLADWEAASANTKTLYCDFWLFEYDTVFNADEPKRSYGELKYETPDKGLYRYQAIGDDGKPQGDYVEQWICDGQSIFELNSVKKELIERPLPPQLQGEGIVNGPLPFLFNAKAKVLKERYWLRLLPPPGDSNDKVLLQAFPKFREDAANFHRAQLLLWVKDLSPYAVELYLPNGKDRNVHLFENTVRNDPLRVIKRDFFKPRLPTGWTKVFDDGQPVAQAPNRVPAPGAQPRPRRQ